MILNGHSALNSVLCRYIWSSEAWLSKLDYNSETCRECCRQTLNRKEQLRHRAVSLRQHGFLFIIVVVVIIIIIIINRTEHSESSSITSGVSTPPTMLTPRLPQPVYTSIVVTDSSSTGVDVIRHIRCFPATQKAASTHHYYISGLLGTSQKIVIRHLPPLLEPTFILAYCTQAG